jgi:hypothetical protein
MGIRKMAMVAALGASLASAPVMAQTSSLSLATGARADAALQDENAQRSTTTTYIIAFFVIIAIGIGIYTITNDDEGPISA